MKTIIISLKSIIRLTIKLLSGQYCHFTRSVKLNKRWFGNNYGGFYVCPDFLNKNSIIYSIGIGEDISFDLAIIENYDCQVFGFDPTPKSINWIKDNHNISSKFIFYEYGIAEKSGMTEFYLPKNKEHISGSIVSQNNIDENQKVVVEMRSWDDIMHTLKHEQIDVLKMDIEGAEYDVLDSILESSVPINQILIEFHERFINDGKNKSIKAIQKLKNHGYEIFGVSASFEEVSFINKSILNINQNEKYL